jgi:hypothetical protein
MKQIIVKKAFTLNLPTGQVAFAAGVHSVDEATAEHWYVQAHSEVLTEAPSTPAVVASVVKEVKQEAPAPVESTDEDESEPAPTPESQEEQRADGASKKRNR